ncbi:hypothetical protein LTR37_021135 [Vermiconidia calcicola]|uniref:Uncharacterized protein n=1 Tax=Vermiconidia calcicola TaxID=1690605 RepID=A0ACC3M9I4_9PEZI|nr:hypothetical protein LTR37_021135 [Vermiconidia calcicola]
MSLASRIKAHLPHSKDSSSTSNDNSTTPTTIGKELNEGSASESKRGKEILSVFDNAFGHLVAGDAGAIQSKFRKMAASSFAFYRGSAPLFYKDLEPEADEGPFLDEKTSRVWIHGDLHAENMGTYMDSQGRLIFNVNDFDEAYVGPFTWDLYRLVASLGLLGYGKALSDDQISNLVKAYAEAYRERIHVLATAGRGKVPRFGLDTCQGPLLDALKKARTQSRFELLDGSTEVIDAERRFKRGSGVIELEDDMRNKVKEAFNNYLKNLPHSDHRGSCRVKDVIARRGVGIGSAGLPTYNVLVEGETEALEYDRIVYLKQSQPSAVSRHVNVPEAQQYFKHEGHRTVISQRALQDHADPWAGWAEIEGEGYMASEVSPYAIDFEWNDINDIEEMVSVVADLGRATAIMHGAADEDSQHSGLVQFDTEQAIDAAISKDEAGFERLLLDFAHKYSARVREDHRLFVDMFRNGQVPGLES